MKVLFLDIDGVVNNRHTFNRYDGVLGIDPEMAFRVGKIILDTDAKIVLSSSWRLWEQAREEVKKRIMDFYDITPSFGGLRGYEIEDWLSNHPDVTRYAILDDIDEMLPEQEPNFFRTTWDIGITEEIAKAVTEHLNKTD